MVKQQLKNIFKSLCSVTAPSGRETLMFSAIEKIVRDMGYEPQYDNFGSMYVHQGREDAHFRPCGRDRSHRALHKP